MAHSAARSSQQQFSSRDGVYPAPRPMRTKSRPSQHSLLQLAYDAENDGEDRYDD